MNACKRTWEVEASRDGRLTGNERMSTERHIELCADCAHERERLEALATALRDLPVRGADELSLRRQRHELLARANAAAAHAERSTSWSLRRKSAVVAALISACALGLLLLWPGSQGSPAGARLVLKPDAFADYTRQTLAGSEIVDLKHGRLTLEVERGDARLRVLVRTPDGEIEDIGTVFTVTVQAARTEAISVAKGRVLARIAGKPERRITAGETHRPYAVSNEGLTVLDPALAPAPPGEARAARALRVHRRTSESPNRAQSSAEGAPAVEPRTAAPAAGDEARPAPTESEVAAEFARAVARVEAHDDARALVLLTLFMDRFADDPRAEDAAFLRVVVLARGSERAALRAAARAYLAKYPHGFRAPEVERLLKESAPPTP
jgi:anti-sigma factor ChrR (cupin superfamily)